MAPGERILVVDDNESNRYTLCRRLRRFGYHDLVEAADGRQALALIESTRPDVVLLDMMMPGMDGITVLQKLKDSAALQKLAVIMVSARSDVPAMIECIELGAEDYLVKPVDGRLLRARMSSILEKRRLRCVESDYLSHFDQATGLPNRSALCEWFGELTDDEGTLAVVVLHLPNYPAVALAEGEESVARELRDVAAQIKEQLAIGEFVGRLSDDSLAWLLPRIGFEHSFMRHLDGVLDRLKELQVCTGSQLISSIACGVAFVRDASTSIEGALRLAASAASRVPSTTRNRVAVVDSKFQEQLQVNLAILGELSRALEQNEFTLHFQPIVSAADGRVVGAESLIRWEHPERGLLAPREFVPVAENSPYIVDLGRWVIGYACDAVHRWRSELPEDFFVGVNLSARELLEGVAADFIRGKGVACDTARLKVELTETTLVEDVKGCAGALQELRDLQIQVALDDFGTGFSSLSHINQIPCDTLKIDRSFVNNIDRSAQSRKIVGAMIAMAHSLELDVVGEGVERPEELTILRELGCDHIQGYLVSRPLPEAEFLHFLNRNSGLQAFGKAS